MPSQYGRYPSLSWKSPVVNAAALPATGNTNGDARVDLNTDTIYIWNGSAWIAVATPGASTAIDGLNGDVSASGPGVVPATVNFVGGSSAAAVNTATIATNSSTFLGPQLEINNNAPVMYFNNTGPNDPRIKWNATDDVQGLKFFSGSTEVANIQDNGEMNAQLFSTYFGMILGDPYVARGFNDINLDFSSVTANTLTINHNNSVPIAVFNPSGMQLNGSFQLNGSTSGAFTQAAADTTTNYSVKWPSAQGAASTTLTNDGAGNLSWAATSSGADTALSNLTTTSINQSLLPDGDVTQSLGNGGLRWSALFSSTIKDGSGQVAFDVSNRTLNDSAGNSAIDVSGSITAPVKLPSNSGNVRGLSFFDTSNTQFVQFQAPATIPSSYIAIWPNAQGGASTVLTNDGSGNLSWASVGSSGANTALSNLTTTAINQNLTFAFSGGTRFFDTADNSSGSDNLQIHTGDASDPGAVSGGAQLRSGDSSQGGTGLTVVRSGNALGSSGASGNALVTTGISIGGSSGSTTVSTGVTTNTGNTGVINVGSGAANGTGNTGGININSGDATAGNSGDIIISAGSATATRGTASLSGRIVSLSSDTFIDAGGTLISNVADPVSAGDAATKQYADGDLYSSRAFSSTTTISGTLATIVFATVDYDSGSNYNNTTGVFTAPIAGKYQVNVGLLITGTIALNNKVVCEIQKNGSVISRFTEFFPATLTDGKVAFSDCINLAATDTIQIQLSTTATAPSIVASNFDNYLSIAKT